MYPFEALPAADALQLRHRDQLLRQCALVDLALVDEDARFSFQHLVESPVPEEEADDDIVREQERKRTDEASGDAVVIADDGVLHRVRQRQQHDQVERIELCQLALAEYAQQHDEKDINEDRPDDFLEDREVQVEHIVQELVQHRDLPLCPEAQGVM